MSSPNKTRVQVATDPAFSNVIHDVEGAYTTALQIAEDVLPKGQNLYARGMHGHPTTGDSSWSTTVQFKIKLAWSDWDGSANGIEYSLNNTTTHNISVASLSSNKVIVSYNKDQPHGYLNSIICTIEGSVISVSSPVELNNVYSQNINNVVVSESEVVIVYRNHSVGGYIYALSVTVIDDIISPISIRQCNSVASTYTTSEYLGNNAMLIAYRNESDACIYAVVARLVNGVVIFGAIKKCSDLKGRYVGISILAENKAILTFREDVISAFIYAILLNIDTTTVNTNSPVKCNTHNSTYIVPITLSETRVLVLYRNDTNSMYLYAILLNVSGNTITAGSPILCNNLTSSTYIKASKLSDNKILVNYRGGDTYLYGIMLNILGDDISSENQIQCNNSNTGNWTYYDISTTKVGNNVLVAYNKGPNTTLYGKVLVG